MVDAAEIERWKALWIDERNGAALYEALAGAEKEPRLAEVYRRLRATEAKHAEVWASKIRTAGAELPTFRPSWRTRMLGAVARRFGAHVVLPTVAGLERADAGKYDAQGDSARLAADERSHAMVISAAARTSGRGGLEGGQLARLEGRHRAVGGNALRAAVLGANDGLVSNLSLVMGVAGAQLAEPQIIATGFAGLLAGACSMALGEWLSVQSSRELYTRQIEIERQEIASAPEEEAEELALIYQARGLDEKQAKAVADRLLADPAAALEALSREELGIDPQQLGGSAWTAAATSFVLFALGAVLPILPFLMFDRGAAVAGSLVAGVVGLFLLGVGITLFTGRNALVSGARQVLFGLVAAGITYAIGTLIGASLA